MHEGTQLFQANNSRSEVNRYNVTLSFIFVVLAILTLIEIYVASMSPGTAPGDFASMTVFP